MKNSIFILNAQDIPMALAVSRNLPDCQSYVFDPTLHDKAIAGGLVSCEFVTWEDCLNYPDLVKWSHSVAFEIEQKLDKSVRGIMPELSICSWQHLNLYYILKTLRWHSGLWTAVAPRFVQHKIHVCFCDSPAQYYWPSYIPALLLMQILNALNIEFSGYAYEKPLDYTNVNTNVVPDLRQSATPSVSFEILSHLPTCFYDFNHFNEELIASGKTVINFQAKYWNVPVTALETVGLSTIEERSTSLPDGVRQQVEAFFEQMVDGLNTILAPYIATLGYRNRQAVHIASLYKAQLITYHLLEARFKQEKPCKILISDHDAGFHGPMIAFAEKHRIPVLMLPHSKVNMDITSSYRGIISLSHPTQGRAILDAHGKAVTSFRLNYPEHLSAKTGTPMPIRKIGLLLNGMALNGVYYTRYTVYMEGIRKIAEWCKQHGIELCVRNRPGQEILRLLANVIGLDLDNQLNAMTCPLGTFVQQGIDLCLMYDMPTTGAIEFLNCSVPILNPIPEPLANNEACIGNRYLIPRDTVEDTLALLDVLTIDAVSFQNFRIKQFSTYVNLFKEARPLRSFL